MRRAVASLLVGGNTNLAVSLCECVHMRTCIHVKGREEEIGNG